MSELGGESFDLFAPRLANAPPPRVEKLVGEIDRRLVEIARG